MNIWIITVNYKAVQPTKELIKSIEKCNIEHNIKILIGDNESSSITKEELKIIKKKSFLDIELFFYSKNHYYWPSIEKILSKKIDLNSQYPDWILICNNDIIINDKNFFNELNKLDGGLFNIIGPRISSSNNDDLNPFLLEPMTKFSKFFWTFYFKSYYFSIILKFFINIKNIFQKKQFSNETKEVYAVHGSAILFSKYFFINGGKLDTNFKLYCEELTTAEISKKIGCKTYYVPKLKIIHKEHSSIKEINSKYLFKLARQSHNYFIKEYS